MTGFDNPKPDAWTLCGFYTRGPRPWGRLVTWLLDRLDVPPPRTGSACEDDLCQFCDGCDTCPVGCHTAAG